MPIFWRRTSSANAYGGCAPAGGCDRARMVFASSIAHEDVGQKLVEDHKLDAAIKLPSGVFRPYE
jgi:hypothetical protein